MIQGRLLARMLAREVLMTGKRLPQVSALAAARNLARAQRAVHLARRQLAQARRRPGSSSYVFTGAWQRADNALENHGRDLRKVHSFLGHGLGYRVTAGIETDEPCVVVFVKRKVSQRSLTRGGHVAVPPYVTDGKRRIATDVVEIRRIHPHAAALESIAPTQGIEAGTIGALAFDAATRQRVAITAMHVSGRQAFGPTSADQGVPFSTPSDAASNASMVYGTTTGVDAAKIVLLDPAAAVPPLEVVGVRQLSHDANIVVHMFGAVSGFQRGIVKYLKIDVPELDLVQTFTVDITSAHGDSGSGLVDESNILLGFLYGEAPADIAPGLKLFCPADLVLQRLGCTLS